MTTEVDDLTDIAARTVLALLGSVPPGTIDPRQYWDRAQAALKAAAMRAENWAEFVTLASNSLQIQSPSLATSESLEILRHLLGPRYPDFRRIVIRTHTYVIAYARIIKEQMKAGAEQ